MVRTLFFVCCASRLLAQHEGHMMSAVGNVPPRFDFSASLLYADFGSLRGDHKLGVSDREMFRSSHFGDRLTLRGMTSVGSIISDSAGMPSLLQTGGTYRQDPIHDVQHPEDFIMEAAAALNFGKAFVYLAPIGAPALGPAPYLHRPSGMVDPVAPIGHHWQDATHVSYGAATAGLRLRNATLEASAFNARESDFDKPWPDFTHARLDSYSGRVTVSGAGVSVASWWGYLKAHEPLTPEMQMHRYGASLSFDRGRSSSLAVWGMNVHHHDGASHLFLHGDPNASPHARSSSMLIESTLGLGDKLTVFGRTERVVKSAEELGFQGGNLLELFDIGMLALGARRDVVATRFARFAIGARGSVTFLPSTLELAYGTRRPMGLDLFAQARRAP